MSGRGRSAARGVYKVEGRGMVRNDDEREDMPFTGFFLMANSRKLRALYILTGQIYESTFQPPMISIIFFLHLTFSSAYSFSTNYSSSSILRGGFFLFLFFFFFCLFFFFFTSFFPHLYPVSLRLAQFFPFFSTFLVVVLFMPW